MWNDNPGVTLNVGNGGLAISGQFDFGQANSYDKIIMTEDAGQLYIWENWNYITLADMEGLWTAGEIAFFGSTWQVNEASGKKSVYSTGTHKILFGGYENGQQVIRWDNPCETIYNSDTGERNTERTLNFDYKQNDLCLGVILNKEYTPENYYFRPEIPDYIAYYQDADNNGINDSIDKILKDGEISKEEYTKSKDFLDEFIIYCADTPEKKEAVAKLISSDNPHEEENTKSLAKWFYDGCCYLADKGKELYEYGKEVITTLAEEIPDAVEVIYDNTKLVISLYSDLGCQSIDFVLNIYDDVKKFECTTEWWADFKFDIIETAPFIKVAKEFVKTGKTIYKNININQYKIFDGLIGYINQQGLIETAKKVTKDSINDIPKVFDSVIGGILDRADNLLKDEELCKRVKNLSEKISEDIQEQAKKIDIPIQTIRLAIDLEPKDRDIALNIIEDKNRLPQLAEKQNFTVAQIIDTTKSIKQNDLTTFVKILDTIINKNVILKRQTDYPYIEIPITLNNIKNHSDFFDKYEIALGKLLNIEDALISTNRFFKQLDSYGHEKVKYSYTVDSSLKGKTPYQQLRQSLYNGGIIQYTGYNNRAHHVVALKEEDAAISRGIIAAVGIDINSATNGVLLPYIDRNTPHPKWAITEAGHPTSHDRDYLKTVQDRLIEALSLYDENLSEIISKATNEQETTEILKKYINNDEKVTKKLNIIVCNCIFDIKVDLLNGDLKIGKEE